jgi:hypothetical protein
MTFGDRLRSRIDLTAGSVAITIRLGSGQTTLAVTRISYSPVPTAL